MIGSHLKEESAVHMSAQSVGRKALTTLAVAVASVLTLAGCAGGATASPGASGGSSESGSLTPVRLAFTPGAATLHVHLAQSMGFFEDHGIDIQVTEGLDLPTWAAALDKQYDVTMTTGGIFVSGADKLNLAAIAGVQENVEGALSNALIARDPKITSIKDLAGKRVGVATITGTTPLSLQYLLREAGEDPSSLSLVQVPFGVQGDQLKAGQVDAIVSASPFLIPVLEDSANHAVYDDVQFEAMHAAVPSQPSSANVFFISTVPWAEKNPELVSSFRAALQDAIDYINANPEDAKAELASWLKLDPALASKVDFSGMTSTVEAAQIRPLIEMSVAMGTLTEDAAPDLEARVEAFE